MFHTATGSIEVWSRACSFLSTLPPDGGGCHLWGLRPFHFEVVGRKISCNDLYVVCSNMLILAKNHDPSSDILNTLASRNTNDLVGIWAKGFGDFSGLAGLSAGDWVRAPTPLFSTPWWVRKRYQVMKTVIGVTHIKHMIRKSWIIVDPEIYRILFKFVLQLCWYSRAVTCVNVFTSSQPTNGTQMCCPIVIFMLRLWVF